MRKIKFLYVAVILASAVLISGFKLFFNTPESVVPPEPMPQGKDYHKEWKAVDSLINLGLPKSALEKTEMIYKQAREEANHPQFIKAVLYKIKLNADFREDFLVRIIRDVQTEIEDAESPVKQILHSIQADIYWRYYQSNRNRFMERTTVAGTVSEDIGTWDLHRLMHEIITQFEASLTDPKTLKKTDLKDYDAILLPGEDSKKVRPTLYDFLANRAIDFFMNDEAGLTQPVHAFKIDQAGYFADAKTFSGLTVTTVDSLSQKFHALILLQDLIGFHLKDKDQAALADVNLKRLRFVKDNATLDKKDSLYLSALNEFEQDIIKEPSSTLVSFAIAQHLYQQGQQYNPDLSEQYRWDIKAAAEKCIDAVERFPESDGAQNCKVLLATIRKTEIELTTETVVVPGQPILSLLEYKNLDTLFFRMARIEYEDARQIEQENRNANAILKNYLELPVFREWTQKVKDENDYQPHSTEIKLEALPAGYFVVLASGTPDFDVDSNLVFYTELWSSDISFFAKQTDKNNYYFYTLNRETGMPLEGVQVALFYQTYDYRTREYSHNAGGVFTSDKSGFFEIPALDKQSRTNSFYLEMKWKGQKLVTSDRFYHSPYIPPTEQKSVKTWFFTDRAIYRPGQTIYFKGIALDRLGDQSEIKTGFVSTVELLDANYQKISELEVTTNEYGSFSGSFIAPSGVLNGRMTIRNGSGSHQIRVEEYKRPTFEVTFEPVKGSYKLNETVTVSGSAKAYAGNVLPGSFVKYRVVREVRFPWLDHFRGYWPIDHSSREIENGTSETDENGVFTIDFTAIPDENTPRKYNPVFNYTIYADVTDMTGETQSAQTSVKVGYEALKVNFDIEPVVSTGQVGRIQFKTTNLNGEPVSAKGTLTLSLLEEPGRLLREKYWPAPDVHSIPKDLYIQDFPHDAWNDEGQVDHLEIKEKLLSQTFDSDTDSLVNLAKIPAFKPGRYSIGVETKDEFGEKVTYSQYFTVYDPDARKPAVNEYLWLKPMKTECEPGENAVFLVASADKKVKVMYEVVREYQVLKSEWFELNNEQKKIEFPVTEDLRGGFTINVYSIKENRSLQDGFFVNVPYTHKKLGFEFQTFRDNLQPGSNETWNIKIKGDNGDRVAAELLASMYDASLDAFVKQSWNFDIYRTYKSAASWSMYYTFGSQGGHFNHPAGPNLPKPVFRSYDRLNWFGFDYYGGYGGYRRGKTLDGITTAMEALPGADGEMREDVVLKDNDQQIESDTAAVAEIDNKPSQGIEIRRDFRETAFFFPDLKTDENGNVVLSFRVPESLTRWKLMGLAHTRDLKYGQFSKEVVTQKELMVVPNPPRFFRQGDQMEFTAKVVNLSDQAASGQTWLKFFDPLTMKEITPEILNGEIEQPFEVNPSGAMAISWSISIPEKYAVVSYEVKAQAGHFSDGETKPIPVLTNRMLVTESLPLPVKGNETKKFVFEKLKNSSNQNTLQNHRLTLEFSSNPAWYAVQALPYMMQEDRESADEAFNRFYANSIASHLANSNPKIKNVFDTWRNYSPDAFISNLEKNQELKSLVLNETPWMLDAKNEKEQKQRIALLFDLNKMSQEQMSALRRLQQLQSPGGGWPWFKGMPDNRYISQQIVLGFAHLRKLGVFDADKDGETYPMLIRAIRYLDQEMKDDYDRIMEHDAEQKDKDHLNHIRVHYLLTRSYFMDEVVISKNQEKAFAYFRDQAIQYWVNGDLYTKGMLALALNNLGVKSAPSQIMASIKEYALFSDEMGMYFRDNTFGYHWYEAPIETQSLLIEAFDEVLKDNKAVEQMKIWLLKQKQTQAWKTSKATAEAVYALLLRGSDWLASDKLAEIKVGNEIIDPMKRNDTKVEAGTGYFKTSWSGAEIKPAMGEITVTNENPTVAWGAVYWQYFEDLDKITPQETPLSLKKQLFVERNTASGPVIEPFTEGTGLKVGDKIKVRIELRVDRDMEFVHMKDMRASAFEPVNVLSGYRYQDGLGYYESTLDASTNFFFDYLRKGTYVFEYPLVASQKGDFSNGITSIQCLYAPEFTSHSEGVRVMVE